MDHLPSDEDITLRIWEDDPDAQALLVMAHAGALQVAIRRAYPIFEHHEVEDVVSEGIRRFWEVRERYDGKRDLRGFLYGFVKNAALEHAGCGLNWQKTRKMEVQAEPAMIDCYPDPRLEQRVDEVESDQSGIVEAAKTVLDKLKPIPREVWLTYAFAREDVNATRLGERLGNELNNGEPIPGANIRVIKSRAIAFVKQEMKKLGFDLDRRERSR